tara:strand:- start:501 stop:794 length:294 start_codon:yes stop_codon:yes gene_type:complete
LLHHTIFDHLRALAPHLPFTPPVSSPSNTSRSLLDLRRETVLLSLLFYATIPSHNWMFNPRSRSGNNPNLVTPCPGRAGGAHIQVRPQLLYLLFSSP